MKRFSYFITMLLLAASSAFAKQGKIDITRIDPPHWWVGMQTDTLQLMVYGKNIAAASASIDYQGVRLEEQVRLDSPDYLLLYLVIGKDAKPGTMPIAFSEGKKKTVWNYELKKRRISAEEHTGFDSGDVLYLVMPDRFARSANSPSDAVRSKGLDYPVGTDRSNPNGRHGGDIAGMQQHLPYIDSLGVTAIWVNPVLENDMPGGSYHGYATTDYYRIDPRMGTNAEWKEFVSEAHKRGVKVVMDMIFNHCGSNHVWFKNRPSHDWFNFPDGYVQTNYRLNTISDPYASDYDRTRTTDGWFVEAMPDLNQRNPHLMKYLVQNSIWWIEESEIDGIRMDTHPYADFNAMASWLKTVDKEYPNFNIVGECWLGSEGGPAFWQKGSKVNPLGDPELPTVMDFPLQIMARDAFAADGGLDKLYEHLSMDFLLADPTHILTFLDNHDTDRFLLEEPKDLDRWKQAMTFLLTSRGIPQLYYGSEILMNGTKQKSDGHIRLDFPGGFPGDATSAFTPEGRTPLQNEAFDFLSKLLNWRKSSEAVRHGSLKHFMPQGGVYAYQRKAADGRDVVIILNGNDKPATMDMACTQEVMPLGTTRKDMLTGKTVTIDKTMELAPREILILE